MPKPSPNRSFSSYSTLPTTKHSSVYKSLVALVSLLPNITNALPIQHLVSRGVVGATKHSHEPLTEGEFYIYLFASITLVLFGGIFAGLTLGLMGQDEVYLKVLADSGTPSEQKCSKDVLKLVGRGKHWLLVTLLLSNVITNETLPVILDRFLGGGLVAVFSSTVSIVIFGEIIPQSVCVRYGLQLGAYFAPFVLCLMYLMYPVAYPISMLLDYILGQDHGTLYKKNGLKTLVTLHKTMGVERLNQDEVTIISSVLDLKAKAVCDIMTPIRKVYTMPSDKILDEDAVEEIFNAGFSRIPIHLPGEPTNFVGMLLVRILISYDPEDALPVSSFPLATLPETSLETSCLNILNYFQEGKSHMVVVSESPGMDTGAVGVLTLEDVIEELIGEEIIDESDVYVDLDKNIKRSIPGPLSKRNVTTYLHSLYASRSNTQLSRSPVGSISVPQQSYFHKRSSIDSTTSDGTSVANARTKLLDQPIQSKQDPTMVPQLAAVTTTAGHQINSTTANGMKPSNLAVDPLPNTNPNVKIKKQPQLSAFNEDRVSEAPRAKTPDYGSVHKTEAQAFVDGVHRNLEREQQQQQQQHSRSSSGRKLSVNHHSDSTTGNGSNSAKQFTLPSGKKKRNSVDLSDAKSSFTAKNDGVPLPKAMTLSTITSNIDSNTTPSYRDNESNRSSRFTQTNLTSSRSDDSEHLIGSPSTESILPTSHSLKSSSGLIENIVNVRGVNKTVIEESGSNINSSVPGQLSVDRNGGIVESESEDDEREDRDLLRKSTSGSNSSNRRRRDSKRFWDWT